MSLRTYIPGLELAVKHILHYGNKWHSELQFTLTVAQLESLDALLAAARALLLALGSG